MNPEAWIIVGLLVATVAVQCLHIYLLKRTVRILLSTQKSYCKVIEAKEELLHSYQRIIELKDRRIELLIAHDRNHA